MGNEPARLKVAAIGHQDSWAKIESFVNQLRSEEHNPPLPVEKIKEVYSFMPPMKLFEACLTSPLTGPVEACYIETFIAPDTLDRAHLWQNIRKVKAACEKAATLGADVVSLGGFTSIILETAAENITCLGQTAFTTGNTLTAAFIADGVEKAARYWQQPLQEATLLVIGSTGDIGSACVSYFSGRVKKLLLAARQQGPLKKQEADLLKAGLSCNSSLSLDELLPQADIVICVASSLLPDSYLELLPEHAIVCDAGYPKNLQLLQKTAGARRIFSGGLGLVNGPCQFTPDYYPQMLNDFPVPNVLHGCLLESVVLAMDHKVIPFSVGRGNITEARMTEILQMAARHGITTAPLFNTHYFFNENGMAHEKSTARTS